MERAELMARRAEIVEKKAETQVAQLAPQRTPGHGKGATGGTRKAARDLGVSRDKIARAKKIAKLSPEAKAAGKDAPQSVLLAAAKEDDPAAQVAVIVAATVKEVKPDPETVVAGSIHDAPDEFFAGMGGGATDPDDVPELGEEFFAEAKTGCPIAKVRSLLMGFLFVGRNPICLPRRCIMATVFDAATYILERRGPMTTMKLQKLVYYSQAWSTVWDDNVIFDEEIEAWKRGPVVRELWEETRGSFRVAKLSKGSSEALTPDQRDTIDAVLKFYGDKDAQWLSDLTHLESPWRDAYEAGQNSTITPVALVEYYSTIEPTQQA